MKKSSTFILLLATVALTAAPAMAKTSISKGKQLCEAAAMAASPTPKSVRTVETATRTSDRTLIFTLNVRGVDDTVRKITCKVDRSTDTATIGS